jgi:methylthioribose-1-phosphate isomerase
MAADAQRPDPIPLTVTWEDGRVRLIDQRRLPGELCFLACTTVADVCDAIMQLAVRGAPALGATAAYAVALAVAQSVGAHVDRGDVRVAAVAATRALVATRPTAVNLAHGAHHVLGIVEQAAARGEDGEAMAASALEAACSYAAADVAQNRMLGKHGAALIPDGARVLTHCNAGGLACVGYGTAIGVVRAAVEAGKRVSVWVDETRPVLQGARLTAWELARLDIPATIVADVMAGSLLASGDVDAVVVGADRVAANGDVANKIGTYTLAVLAARHGVPFYVAAPRSTIDLATPTGAAITIEVRDSDEVTHFAGERIGPAGVAALNRAFDVTPAELVTAIVTERGVVAAPDAAGIARIGLPS